MASADRPPPYPTHWEANRAVLRKIYPGLLDELLRHESDASAQVETAATGALALRVNGLYAHSPRDPEKEGQRLAEACLAGASGEDARAPVLVLGFGLGYAAQEISRLAPLRPLVIVEKNPGLLRRAFELRDMSAFLSRPGIAFAPGGGGEGAVAALSFFEKAGEKPGDHGALGAFLDKKRAPLVLRNRALTAIDEQWYAATESRVNAWATQGDVNRATLGKFGKRWMRNLRRNLGAIRDLPGISRLAGIAGGEAPAPVFLAAAGPSLDCAGAILREIRERCVVVAVDTSLRFFRRHEVEPDFAFTVDPQFWNSRHLDRCAGGPRVRLVAESAVYPPALRLPFKGAFLCGSLFPLGAFIEKRVDPKGILGAGGSVATSAWDFCRLLGAREIWVAGLDLAFPGGKTHFKGALFEEKALAESRRLRPAETLARAAMRSGGIFPAQSVSGVRVLTDRRLSLYASWFESNLRDRSGARSIRLWHEGRSDADGLAIPGFDLASAESLLALPPRRAEIDARLDAAFARAETEFLGEEQSRQRSQRYEDALAALRSGMAEAKLACARGEELAAQALRSAPGPARRKALDGIAEASRALAQSEAAQVAGFLLPAQALDEAANPPPSDESPEAFRARMESSREMYRRLAEAADEIASIGS